MSDLRDHLTQIPDLFAQRPDACQIPGCDRPYCSRGVCQSHWEKAKRQGLLDQLPRVVRLKSKNYMDAHRRVKRARGRAAEYMCVDCGGRAEDWSYIGAAPDEMRDKWGPFSYDVNSYEARCRPCHLRFDHPPVDICPRGHVIAEVGRNSGNRCKVCNREDARARYWRLHA